jgi:hypothetical protein
MENETNLKRQISFFVKCVVPVSIIPLITALIYIAGSVQCAGYLDGFGIQSNMFPLDVSRILMQGLYYLLVKTVYFLAAMAILGVIILVFYILCLGIFKVCKFDFMKEILIRFRKCLIQIKSDGVTDNKKRSKIAIFGWYVMAFSYFLLLMLLMFYFAMIFGAHKSGTDLQADDVKKWQAVFASSPTSLHDTFKKEEYRYYMDFTAKDKDAWMQESGFVIAGNDTYLAIYTKEGVKIYPARDVSMRQHMMRYSPTTDA